MIYLVVFLLIVLAACTAAQWDAQQKLNREIIDTLHEIKKRLEVR